MPIARLTTPAQELRALVLEERPIDLLCVELDVAARYAAGREVRPPLVYDARSTSKAGDKR